MMNAIMPIAPLRWRSATMCGTKPMTIATPTAGMQVARSATGPAGPIWRKNRQRQCILPAGAAGACVSMAQGYSLLHLLRIALYKALHLSRKAKMKRMMAISLAFVLVAIGCENMKKDHDTKKMQAD